MWINNFYKSFRLKPSVFFNSKRLKGSAKKKWANTSKAITSTQLALKHFDDFYKPIYGGQWPSIRLAMLSQQKYCAVVNNFTNVDDVLGTLSCLGADDIFDVTISELELQLRKEQEKLEQNRLEKQSKMKMNLEKTLSLDLNFDILSDYKSSQSQRLNTNENLAEDNDESSESEDEVPLEEPLTPGHPSFYDFVPVTELKGLNTDISESDYFAYYNPDAAFDIEILPVTEFQYPKNLKVFTFERGNISLFPAPRSASKNLLGYYLLDAASLLPVLALDIRPKDYVLDLCAAPGGKTLIIIQTLLPDKLVCNDVSISRRKRLEQVLRIYVPEDKLKNVIIMTKDGKTWEEESTYDKVLVDVPCTTDRHVLFENENNIFHPHRLKDRVHLPELQSLLLSSGIRAVKPGGSVVYSTCALCPVQNDGIVQRAIQQIRNTSEIEVVVRDLSPLIKCFQKFFNFHKKCRYGQLVIPHLAANFGPMYFSKIQRIK